SDGSVAVSNLTLYYDRFAEGNRRFDDVEHFAIERVGQVERNAPNAAAWTLVAWTRNRVQHWRQVQCSRLRVAAAADPQNIGAPDHLIDDAKSEPCHDLSHFFGNE